MAQEPTQKKPGLLELLDEWEKQGASDAEITWGMRNYFSIVAREKGVPLRGSFELTPLCNLDCKMCYVHMSQEQLVEQNRRILPTSQWIRIMSEAIEAGMTSAALTGGEALLYPGFDEIYLFLQEKGIGVTVKTNGLMLTDSRISFFKQNRPNAIFVSVYGSDDDSYERVTGRRCFSQVIDNIIRATDAGLRIHVLVTPSKYLRGSIQSLLKMMNDLGIGCTINRGLIAARTGTGRSNTDSDLTLDEYVEVFKYQLAIKGHSCIKFCGELPTEGGDAREENSSGLICGAGRDGFAITWDGKMQPCVIMSDYQIDISDFNFRQAWAQIHEYVSNYPRPEECEGCVYQQKCGSCVVQHGYGAIRGHANPKICEATKTFIKEGIFTFDSSIVNNEVR